MAKVKVYKVKVYDATADRFVLLPGKITRETAELIKGVPLEESASEVEESELNQEGQWTPPVDSK